MATTSKKLFLTKSELKASDREHKRKLMFNITKYNQAVMDGKKQYNDLDLARKKAKNIKWKAIENLETNLLQFETNFTNNGGQVIWALDAEQANKAVLNICQKHNTTLVVKSKSMVTEEIHLNEFLQNQNIESIETDLGEYIQQLDNEPPYHIVTPAMHKSKEDIAKLFHEKLGADPQLEPNELALVARKKLRSKYTEAQIGISGGNFLLADIGGIALTENEGNVRLTTALPKVHIAIIGIEKMLSSVDDLQTMWPLLATYGTGQKMTVYNTIISGPKKENETDGPEEMYVILLDNGRTDLLKDTQLRESTYCIRCGSCLNVCPVYQNIGGHSYGTTYSGPIGAVISPHLNSFKEYNHLSHASTLCGQCTDACPLNINIHGMLHYNRSLAKEKGSLESNEKSIWKSWQAAMSKNSFLGLSNAKNQRKAFKNLFSKNYFVERPKLSFGQTFKELYKEYKK
jgi:L-lactate dehydrogenase complex protein LldF